MLITLNIQPDSIAPQVVTAYARSFGWRSAELDGEVNAYAKAKLIESVMDTLRQQRATQAEATARTQAMAEVNAAVTIT